MTNSISCDILLMTENKSGGDSMDTITVGQANEKVLKMFNDDIEWKDLVKGKTLNEIKSIWREDYNIAYCLIAEDYNIVT